MIIPSVKAPRVSVGVAYRFIRISVLFILLGVLLWIVQTDATSAVITTLGV